jgi:predicted glycoside hydrolase/deacetylase ChbG (UPF0249 family)
MLQIIADDLGLDPAVNEGIFFAFKNGLIDKTSLMANGLAFDHAVAGLAETADLKLGIHLSLVEEKSLLDKEQIPTLVNGEGFFYKNHRLFFIRYILGLIKKDDIKKGAEAQIHKCLEAGIKPEFINSHQHLHLLPGVMDIIISLAKKYGIPYIRIVHEPLDGRGSLFRKAQLCFVRFLSGMAKKRIIRSGLRCNDFFIGFLNAGNLSKSDIDLALKINNDYPDKTIELGCHPGFETESLKIKYKHWGVYNWQKEIKMLQEFIHKNIKT